MRTDAWSDGAVSKEFPQIANVPKHLFQTCCCDHINFAHVQRYFTVRYYKTRPDMRVLY
jgi:hypothetical protein